VPGIPRHPNEAQLLAFGEGTGASEDRVWIDAHLVTCPSCQDRLTDLMRRRLRRGRAGVRSRGRRARPLAWLLSALLIALGITAVLAVPWFSERGDVGPETPATAPEPSRPPVTELPPLEPEPVAPEPAPAVEPEAAVPEPAAEVPAPAPEAEPAQPEAAPEAAAPEEPAAAEPGEEEPAEDAPQPVAPDEEPPAAEPAAESPAAKAPVEPPAEEPAAAEPASETPREFSALVPEAPPSYRPDAALVGSLASVRSAPVIRAGVGSDLPELRALAPEHVGATVSAAPTLYWFLGGRSSVPVEVALGSEGAAKPLLELRLEPPVAAGIHALALPKYGVSLEPGVTYRWSVALVSDAANRDADAVSSAAIRRNDANDGMLASAGPAERAHALAAAGYWYDAFDVLTGWIQKEPGAERLREHRAALLEQVGLSGVAALLAAPAPSAASDPEHR
jgi:hypothetical protein